MGAEFHARTDLGGPASAQPPKLLDRVRQAVRVRHYSRKTEEAYVAWIRRYIVFHGKRHPAQMGAREITAYLEWLAGRRRASASTQNQALSALLFLYREVLRLNLEPLAPIPRARTPSRLPVVLSHEEVVAVLRQISGTMWIIVTLLYGAGLRLRECLELRVKDLDFDRHQIIVRRGKGHKDRATLLPAVVKAPLRAHLAAVRQPHEQDLREGYGRVVLPWALDRKYPDAATAWAWQFVFPAGRICRDPRWGPPSRWHLHESVVQKAVAEAARRRLIRPHAVNRATAPARRTGSKIAPSRRMGGPIPDSARPG